MRYIYQHRRGSTTQWADKSNLVPCNGEIVIEDCSNGRKRIYIGDGITPFSNLKPLSTDDFVKPDAVTVQLLATNWVGTQSPYYQIVSAQVGNGLSATYSINGVPITATSKIDLQPTPEQLTIFHEKDVAFTTENNIGDADSDKTVKVYAIGVKPQNDYVIQGTVTEVVI